MNELVHFVARHGYWLLVIAVLGRQACLPVPANLLLVAAAALTRSGQLNLSAVVGLSVLTFLLADLVWYALISILVHLGKRWQSPLEKPGH